MGAYDSASTSVMEQHARWMKEGGAGAINVSWWGKDSDTDRLVPTLMDVMAAHDLRVAFHLEPYRDRHAAAYASDIEYLVHTFNEWHEGHQFEPMKNDAALPEEQVSRHYHNAADGGYRLKTLTSLLSTVE